MKKASDYLKEYLEKTHGIQNEAYWSDKEVLHFAKSYAMHVAAEQDKLTRHAAAQLVSKYASVGATDLVHGKIMNLQTKIKETQL